VKKRRGGEASYSVGGFQGGKRGTKKPHTVSAFGECPAEKEKRGAMLKHPGEKGGEKEGGGKTLRPSL